MAALVDDLADAEIVVDQDAPADLERVRARAPSRVFNRGVPGFAVDADGTLHTSLMRSCTGWPSGTWIDPPRRTAPDGSNFQLQHWTHTFDYAVACGDGDWRDAGHPLAQCGVQPAAARASPPTTTPTSGGLPSWGSLLEVEPARDVALGALKVVGNPIAGGSGRRRRRRRRHRAAAGRDARPDHRRRHPLGPAQRRRRRNGSTCSSSRWPTQPAA